MARERVETVEREHELDAVILAYVEAVEAGERPDRRVWLERYPHLKAELEAFFRDEDRFDLLVSPIRSATPPPSRARTLSTIPPSPSLAGRTLGDYELIEEIARGGMGIVYRARQKGLGRIVAVKMIRSGQVALPEDVQRFRLEAEAVAGLDHPNIVPIYEIGEFDSQPYFSMKLIEGGNLTQWLKGAPGQSDKITQQRATLNDAVRMMVKVTRAVDYAHQRGLLHRDLKPANILVDRRGEPHVTDFGLATRLNATANTSLSATVPAPGLTGPGIAVGTPSYMAPEQAVGPKQAVTVAADVYSLGAVLYEMLTGQPPFRGETALETLAQVLERPPIAPRTLDRTLPRDLETICLKCLEKEPARRYRSAAALADDLERYLSGDSIQARPVGAVGRFWRWCRRNPVVATLGAAVLLLLLTGLPVVTGLWQLAEFRLDNVQFHKEQAEKNWHRSEEHRREEEIQRDLYVQEAQKAVEKSKEAQANLREAQEILNVFCLGLGDAKLNGIDGLQPLRKEMLETALKYLEGFLKKKSDDPEVLADLAQTQFRVAQLTAIIGSKTKALDAYGRALERYQEVLDSDPKKDHWARAEIAATYINSGALQDLTNDPKGALQSYEKAQGMLEILQKESQGEEKAKYLADLAAAECNLGNLHRVLGHLDNARIAYDRAITIGEGLVHDRANEVREQLKRDDPELAGEQIEEVAQKLLSKDYRQRLNQSSLAVTYVNVGILQSSLGNSAAALRYHEKAKEIQEKIRTNNPHNRDALRDLALTYRRIGNRLAVAGKPDEALELLNEGDHLIADLAKANPSVTEFGWELAVSRRTRGHVHRDLGDPNAAMNDYRSAADGLRKVSARDPQVANYRTELAGVLFDEGVLLAECNAKEQAVKAYREGAELRRAVAKSNPDNLDNRTDLGIQLSNLGKLLSDLGHNDEALPLLREAILEQRFAYDRAPLVRQHRDALIRHHLALAEVLVRIGHPDDGLAVMRECVGLFEKQVSTHPDEPEYLWDLAAAHKNLGYFQRDSRKRLDDSLIAFIAARDVLEELVRRRPDEPDHLNQLAKAFFDIGTIHAARKNRTEELPAYEKSRDLRERLVKDHSEVIEYHADLGKTLINLGYTYAYLNRTGDSLTTLRRAVEQYDLALTACPHVATYRRGKNNAYGALAEVERVKGQPAAAAVALCLRRDLWPGQAQELFLVARDQSAILVSLDLRTDLTQAARDERPKYVKQALETLGLAVAAGFKDSARLQNDPMLAPLRELAEFKKLTDTLPK
jgi:serine/threonine-protein kinase